MIVKVHHLKDGTFAAEIPDIERPVVVRSNVFYSVHCHEDQYDVLRTALLKFYGLLLPPMWETNLLEPGEDEVQVKIERRKAG